MPQGIVQPGRTLGSGPSNDSSNLSTLTTPVSFNGRTVVFEATDWGSIPHTGTNDLC
jgi:hypothetical protein